jgi:hypothetical protein
MSIIYVLRQRKYIYSSISLEVYSFFSCEGGNNMILEENENLRKKIKNVNGESEEERLNNAKEFVMRDEAIIKEMVETIFMTDIKVKKVKMLF